MVRLQVEVSSYCNMKCPICSHKILTRQMGFMPIELWQKIVLDAKENGHLIDYLHHMGEPLLWPHIINGINFLTKNGLKTQISTNGILLTEEMAKNLYYAGQEEIIVAIDTLNPNAYEKIRGSKTILENIKKNIYTVLSNTNLKIKAQFMPTKYNLDETKDDFLKEFESPNFFIDDWFVVRPEGAENVSTFLTHTIDEIDKSLCDKLYERLVVLWNGLTVLCCLDVQGEMITGDLNKNSISEIFYGDRAEFFREQIKSKKFPQTCKKCFADHLILHNIVK